MSDEKLSLTVLKQYLGTEERPVENSEFTEFWKSLTDEEKEEFKSTPLT